MRFLPQFDPPSLHWSVPMTLDRFVLYKDSVEVLGRPILLQDAHEEDASHH